MHYKGFIYFTYISTFCRHPTGTVTGDCQSYQGEVLLHVPQHREGVQQV